MMQGLYVVGDTWLHRLPATWKLGLLVLAGVGLFLVRDLWVLSFFLVLGMGLLWRSGVGAQRLWRQTRGVLLIVLVVFAAAAFFDGMHRATEVMLRLLTLISLALAVTLTTRSSELLEVCERALRPFDALGWVDSARVSLALSLCLRFIPEIHRRFHDIREAQAARGIRANPVWLIVPLVVATLKSADVIAEAIDARGYPPPRAQKPASPGKVRPPP